MAVDWTAASALVVVLVFFAVIIFLRLKTKTGFTPLILGAMAAGIGVGFAFSGHVSWVRPIGTIYISVLTSIVAPLIIVSILSSVTSLGSVKQLRGIGVRSVFWLLVTTALSIALALFLGLAFGIGKGAEVLADGFNTELYEKNLVPVSQVITNLFPGNIINDIGQGRIIPYILFTMLIAVSYVLVAGEQGSKVVVFKQFIEASREVIFKAVAFIIELTPFAVLALVAESLGSKIGSSTIILSLGIMLLVSFLAFAIDIWLIGGVMIRLFARLNPFKFFRKIIPAQVVAFSTQSSAGTLPVTTRVLREEVGVGSEVAGFTAPLGTTIGMPGCAGIWPVLTAIYGIHALGIDYAPRDYLILALISLFVSLGTAGVPGTATITTTSVLAAAGLPLEILVITIPIAAIADTGRTATNVTAAAIAATIVARQEGALNDAVFRGEVAAGAAEVTADAVEAGDSGIAATEETESGYVVPLGACAIDFNEKVI
ncbi:MAG: dicarboxylate/amino acid:cation symporter [Clostridiales Family XIII bacterium]|jgi:Na+/H+-dicarboxylate symporter|nr:dicarboxylate/amino acid:cation symporter [Clostridiales Family XIII bacterium]